MPTGLSRNLGTSYRFYGPKPRRRPFSERARAGMDSRVTFGQFAICCSANSPVIARLCSASASRNAAPDGVIANNSSNQVLVCSLADGQNWTGNTVI